ncbi:type II toxin-antitoxin system Phd/YefM family antitoxin [Geodermatophilus telluris]|uniref:type II toxin-antitoxin system Phd/YefM family antitoxin n=1 Tax=Geodermatophilus telluris TaxID=1190417 RepID=UPI000B862781|nr:type II toxin-antitoxin system Phd/YefM family antitoxin [Geodermatophilus telluris]
MTTVSPADAKARLSRLVARTSGQHERAYVTVHGRPSAVLRTTDDLWSLKAIADAMRWLHTSEAELARGEAEGRDELDAAIARRRSRQRIGGVLIRSASAKVNVTGRTTSRPAPVRPHPPLLLHPRPERPAARHAAVPSWSLSRSGCSLRITSSS